MYAVRNHKTSAVPWGLFIGGSDPAREIRESFPKERRPELRARGYRSQTAAYAKALWQVAAENLRD